MHTCGHFQALWAYTVLQYNAIRFWFLSFVTTFKIKANAWLHSTKWYLKKMIQIHPEDVNVFIKRKWCWICLKLWSKKGYKIDRYLNNLNASATDRLFHLLFFLIVLKHNKLKWQTQIKTGTTLMHNNPTVVLEELFIINPPQLDNTHLSSGLCEVSDLFLFMLIMLKVRDM